MKTGMEVRSNQFLEIARQALHDPDLQLAVQTGTGIGYNKRQAAMYEYGYAHGEALRLQAAASKRRALQHLPELLEQAEAALLANGFQVLWAIDAAEANQHVLDIARRHHVRRVVKSKSMVTEETGLNHALEGSGIQVLETDLGEFIVQLGGETPSHIVTPIVHKTKANIRDTLIREAGMPPSDDTQEMAAFARAYLREQFLQADMGISGANFVIAETGSICLVTNEGNGRFVTSLPEVHVALAGIEKVVATLEDYATLTQLLPRSATGQAMTVYTQMIHGPRRPDENDGPKHVYVILLDNGRSGIYATEYAESLACIRCGACLNACPVYQATGGHAYGWVYPGPIGAVVTPLLAGLENATPLPHASSLCGACKQVCPVDIDLPRMLLDLRHDLVVEQHHQPEFQIGLRLWSWLFKSPRRYRWAGKAAALFTRLLPARLLPGPLRGWTRYRDFPDFPRQTFHDLWLQRTQRGMQDEQP